MVQTCFRIMRRAYDGVYLLVVMILTTGLRPKIANDVHLGRTVAELRRHQQQGFHGEHTVNQHGWMPITADSYLTVDRMSCRWKNAANQHTKSDVTSRSSVSSLSVKSERLTAGGAAEWKTAASELWTRWPTFPLCRYITAPGWQRSAHPGQQDEHVAAPFHHQHHAPSQPQAAARRGGQNREQELHGEFECLAKSTRSVLSELPHDAKFTSPIF